MTARDLLEMASLDALGLLDERERVEFEAAFNSASPEMQAALRRAQLQATRVEHLLPQVDPPPGLRARVLSAVRAAIAAMAVEAAAQEQATVVGRIGPSSVVHRLMTFAPMWRAACLAFMTATIVLAVFNSLIKGELVQLRDRQLTEAMNSEFGRYFETEFVDSMMNGRSQWLSFVPAAQDIDPGQGDRLRAKVLYNPDTRVAFFRVEGLPSDSAKYMLIFERDGSAISSSRREEFYGNHGAVMRRLDEVNPTDLNAMVIYGPDANGVVGTPLLRVVAAL